MAKIPVYIEIEDFNGILNTIRAMATIPSMEVETNYQFVNFGRFMEYQGFNKRHKDLEIDIIEEDNNDFVFSHWANNIRTMMEGQTLISFKKNLRIKYINTNLDVFFQNCLITSYTQEILDDEDIFSHEVFKNYNSCKREVLFEKIGHEKIRIILSLSISYDNFVIS
jgi:hypothetical protein